MSVLAFAHLARPEYFHKISGARFGKIIEVAAKSKFMKETGCAWAVGVPASPDSFAIVLITNNELLESGEIEMQFSPRAQSLDRLDKHEIGRARAKTWIGRRRQNKKFAGFEVGGGLQADLGEPGDGVLPALRHLFDLLENQPVEIVCLGRTGAANQKCAANANRNRSFSHEADN